MEDLWKIRQRKQMSVAQLSSKAGIPARLINEYEAGRKTIPMENLEKLARALFVDVIEIKPLSAPIPPDVMPGPAGPMREREPQREPPREREREQQAVPPPSPPRLVGRPPRREEPAAVVPARESQIAHLLMLAERFGWDQSALEKEIGRPLSALTRPEASRWLKELQERIATEHPRKAKRRRPYLPESVDNFEFEYLQQQMDNGASLNFTLFNGQQMTGRLIGFGPYNITIANEQGETTLNKLAIAYYQLAKGGTS